MLLIPPSHSYSFLAKFFLICDSHNATPGEAFMKVSEEESRSKFAGTLFTVSEPQHLLVLHLRAGLGGTTACLLMDTLC